jgi:hypothetical protein
MTTLRDVLKLEETLSPAAQKALMALAVLSEQELGDVLKIANDERDG